MLAREARGAEAGQHQFGPRWSSGTSAKVLIGCIVCGGTAPSRATQITRIWQCLPYSFYLKAPFGMGLYALNVVYRQMTKMLR